MLALQHTKPVSQVVSHNHTLFCVVYILKERRKKGKTESYQRRFFVFVYKELEVLFWRRKIALHTHIFLQMCY